MNMILLALLGLFTVSLALIWTDPKSARYVADICWRRARALEAARRAYQRAWHEGEQGTMTFTAIQQYGTWSDVGRGDPIYPSTDTAND